MELCERCGDAPSTVTMASERPHAAGTPPVHGPTHRYCAPCARALGAPVSERSGMHARALDHLARRESRVTADAASICDALLATLPQWQASRAVAMRDLTDPQCATLLVSRDETLRTIRAGMAELQERLDELTRLAHTLGAEFKGTMHGPDRRRLQEIAEWFEANNDEVGVLKVAIEELRDLVHRLETLSHRESGAPPGQA